MKKLFPDAPDVPMSVANRAVRIVEKCLRVHRVERTRDLPEEAKVRLYRDLRFLFEGGGASPNNDGGNKGRGVRGRLSRLWEKLEDFLSAAESSRERRPATVLSWLCFGESARFEICWNTDTPTCDDSG